MDRCNLFAASVSVAVLAVVGSSTTASAAFIPDAIQGITATGFQWGTIGNGTTSASASKTQLAVDGSGLTVGDPNDSSTWLHTGTVTGVTKAEDTNWGGEIVKGTSELTTDQWVAAHAWMVLDLGKSYTNNSLESMYIWNGMQPFSNSGVKTMDIYYATNPTVTPPVASSAVQDYDFSSGGWTKFNGSTPVSVNKANGNGGTDVDATIDLSGIASARYIGMNFLSGQGGNESVGFAEVQVTAVPEPASLTVLGLGGLLTLRRRRIMG